MEEALRQMRNLYSPFSGLMTLSIDERAVSLTEITASIQQGVVPMFSVKSETEDMTDSALQAAIERVRHVSCAPPTTEMLIN